MRQIDAIYLWNNSVAHVVGGSSEDDEVSEMTPLGGAACAGGFGGNVCNPRYDTIVGEIDTAKQRENAAGFLRKWADALQAAEQEATDD